jgi:hypothetical protein
MTTTPETSVETLDVVSLDTETTLEPVSPTPVLISEQEVVLSTAAAALVPPAATRRRWLGATLIAAVHRIHIGLPEPRPHYPQRDASYFEAARMSRQMDHL